MSVITWANMQFVSTLFKLLKFFVAPCDIQSVTFPGLKLQKLPQLFISLDRPHNTNIFIDAPISRYPF